MEVSRNSVVESTKKKFAFIYNNNLSFAFAEPQNEQDILIEFCKVNEFDADFWYLFSLLELESEISEQLWVERAYHVTKTNRRKPVTASAKKVLFKLRSYVDEEGNKVITVPPDLDFVYLFPQPDKLTFIVETQQPEQHTEFLNFLQDQGYNVMCLPKVPLLYNLEPLRSYE